MNNPFLNGTYETEFEEEVITVAERERIIILHNDDYNTFDHVIESLIEICGHGIEQAEQCAHITHYNGKCDVKKGPQPTLERMYRKLKVRGLSVTLEE
jgi:ATP-dependent Clp protease adaptor protein ClpS